jgi:NRAMP (natural resistance-associated macrophage protein)-like metal ion transporter
VLTVQSLAANLGIITGRHLAELCMGEYPKYVKYCLWLLAELGVIAATIPGGMYQYLLFVFAFYKS